MKTASKFFRLPLIRHARYYWHLFWLNVWDFVLQLKGARLGKIKELYIEHFYKIWRGEA